jgi:5-methyltetrahydropteroyltriglutamate--homocysteine methyltransferase
VPAERVTVSTDCGMKPLPRPVAKLKLKALADGARIVREEIGQLSRPLETAGLST